MQAALDHGLILDEETQRQLILDETYTHMAPVAGGLVWPPEPLHSVFVGVRCAGLDTHCVMLSGEPDTSPVMTSHKEYGHG